MKIIIPKNKEEKFRDLISDLNYNDNYNDLLCYHEDIINNLYRAFYFCDDMIKIEDD